ncbi:phage tail sheath subtilisin-like domain-containing protein [Tumebacillus sp. ITR2]|uniref:Phage tail sheath subtilisin-like domain-containing protein n=1 Tax=Tumebacillus amylolyticus TaxID=2801339 RepID=A0ABS1JCC4_9BACL|nr:phage tail sheath subtilisin-like domain-containing protein [Tumebacillus amylolyticus]MBL0387922.1 phage tail sheath subtilisin-like domain-containing protein [Tumebacillus amylolyticus]
MSNQQYIVPRVGVSEMPPELNTSAGVSLGVIGIVGTFSKGPINTPITCYNVYDVKRQFGDDAMNLTGFKSARGAFNQDPRPEKIVIVRVASAAAKTASLDLLDGQSTPKASINVSALTKGTDGNNVSVKITAGSTPGTFDLVVSYKRLPQETFTGLDLDTLGIPSSYVTLTKAAGANDIPAPLDDTPLSGGDDGATTADADYIGSVDTNGVRTGLKVLETVNVNVVLCAQQTSNAINQALIQHCEQMNVQRGLRVAVLNAKKAATPSQTIAAQTYNSGRAIMAYPWVYPVEDTTKTVAPDGYYAGVLAALAAHISPSSQKVQGIAALERVIPMDADDADLIALTMARISPFAQDIMSSEIVISNGLTTFSYADPATQNDWSQTCYRRIFDKVEMDVAARTKWAKSQPITEKGMFQPLRDQIDMILRDYKDKGEIFDFRPTICDKSNNTAETIQARRVITGISIRPAAAADYIDHNISRFSA